MLHQYRRGHEFESCTTTFNRKGWVSIYDNLDSLHLIPNSVVLKYKFHVFIVLLNKLFVGEVASLFSSFLFICRYISFQ